MLCNPVFSQFKLLVNNFLVNSSFIEEHMEVKTEKEHEKIRKELIFFLLDFPFQLMQHRPLKLFYSEVCKLDIQN